MTYAPETPAVTLDTETGELKCRVYADPQASVSWERPEGVLYVHVLSSQADPRAIQLK